jgi:predicted ATPase with chaperone activity
VLRLGPPGAGTSRLARRLTTILPAMTLAEAIETTRIHRVAGLIGDRPATANRRCVESIYEAHGAQATQYRTLDRERGS